MPVPSDTYAHSTLADATPDEVFTSLQRAETWRGIGPIDDVWGDTHDEGLLTGFRWSARAAGQMWEGRAERTGWDRDRSMSLALDSAEIGGSITVALTPLDRQTRVTVTMEAHSKGLLSGMFWGVVSSAIARGLPTQVDRFARGF